EEVTSFAWSLIWGPDCYVCVRRLHRIREADVVILHVLDRAKAVVLLLPPRQRVSAVFAADPQILFLGTEAGRIYYISRAQLRHLTQGSGTGSSSAPPVQAFPTSGVGGQQPRRTSAGDRPQVFDVSASALAYNLMINNTTHLIPDTLLADELER
ncbi:unnamed protein product, partial [Amoebophrya sp. A120]